MNRFITNPTDYSKANLLSCVTEILEQKHQSEWFDVVNSLSGASGRGGNKLRTYKLFKAVYRVEPYCQLFLPVKHRSAFSKFRCGVAPLRLETGRFEGLEVEQRICPVCGLSVEDEKHVLLECSFYQDLRTKLFKKACEIYNDFHFMTQTEQVRFLFSSPDIIRLCAKTCYLILQKRANFLHK